MLTYDLIYDALHFLLLASFPTAPYTANNSALWLETFFGNKINK